MNPEVTAEVVVTVRWNTLEGTILSHLEDGNRGDYIEVDYTFDELVKLSVRAWRSLHPHYQDGVPDRFKEEDHTGKVPMEELNKNIDTLVANARRLNVMTDQFRYNPTTEL